MKWKRMVRNTVCWLLATTFILLGYVNKAKRQSFQDGVIIPIYFHNPGRKLFRRVVIWLKNNGYTFISCDQLIEILGGRVICPKGAVWLSLDGGWKGNIHNVIPIVAEYDIPITLFICTDAVEGGTFWWQDVRRYANRLPADFNDDAKIRRLPEDTRKQVLKLITQAAQQGNSIREAMNIEDVKRISTMPQVTIGSHSASHSVLPNCTDIEIDYELGESKRKLEEWTGKPIRAFAYPNGAFNGRERQFLKKYGYELAVIVANTFATINSDCYLFPRTDYMDDGSFAENLCHALGVWEPIISKIRRTPM
jgi:peptidoglycan/xylan/chitin deacetylase (PgdA/CDA1 family)